MFRKLYGETEEDQLYYLGKKIKITAIMVAIGVVCIIVGLIGQKLDNQLSSLFGISEVIYVIIAYFWGWGFMKSLLGIVSFGVFVSGNWIISVIVLTVYVLLGGFFGVANVFIGILRYIYLRVKNKSGKGV